MVESLMMNSISLEIPSHLLRDETILKHVFIVFYLRVVVVNLFFINHDYCKNVYLVSMHHCYDINNSQTIRLSHK